MKTLELKEMVTIQGGSPYTDGICFGSACLLTIGCLCTCQWLAAAGFAYAAYGCY